MALKTSLFTSLSIYGNAGKDHVGYHSPIRGSLIRFDNNGGSNALHVGFQIINHFQEAPHAPSLSWAAVMASLKAEALISELTQAATNSRLHPCWSVQGENAMGSHVGGHCARTEQI
jgi:hypothetical protein